MQIHISPSAKKRSHCGGPLEGSTHTQCIGSVFLCFVARYAQLMLETNKEGVRTESCVVDAYLHTISIFMSCCIHQT